MQKLQTLVEPVHFIMSSDPLRLFLALWPDDAQRRALAAHQAAWQGRDQGNWYAPADWHVTLWFLGAVERTRCTALADACAAPFETCELLLDQAQLWPHGLAVLCASQVPAPLLALRQGLARVARAEGLNLEPRPYRPHVTLARRATSAVAPLGCAPVPWRVDGYALVRSTGDRSSRYEVIHCYGA